MVEKKEAKRTGAARMSNRSSLKLDIDESVMSAHVKARLREGLTQRDKQLITVAKKLAKAESDKVADGATAEAEAAAAAGERSVVLELAGGMDSKSMGAIVQKVLKTTAIAVFALSVDDSAGKVACVAAVPDSDVEALAANKWLQAVLALVERFDIEPFFDFSAK